MKTLTEIYNDIANELKSEFAISELGKTLEAFAQVHALSLYLYLKEQQEIQKNFNPETAYSEAFGGTLEAFGRRVLGREPRPAIIGNYNVGITGNIGGVVFAETTLRDDNNNLFEVQSDVILTEESGIVNVNSFDAGTDFELSVGQILYFTEPIANINSDATVSSVITSPIDAESLDEYKYKIVSFEKIEPQGGSAADYRIWGLDATGVVNIYAYSGTIGGDINIFVEGNTDNGVPPQSVLDDVAEVIEFNPDTTIANRGRRPFGAFNINISAINPIVVDIDIVNLRDNSASVLDTIESAVSDYLKSIRPSVDGADDPNESNSILSLGNINTIVNNALEVGNTYDNVILKVGTIEITSYEFLLGNIPYLTSINAINAI